MAILMALLFAYWLLFAYLVPEIHLLMSGFGGSILGKLSLQNIGEIADGGKSQRS